MQWPCWWLRCTMLCMILAAFSTAPAPSQKGLRNPVRLADLGRACIGWHVTLQGTTLDAMTVLVVALHGVVKDLAAFSTAPALFSGVCHRKCIRHWHSCPSLAPCSKDCPCRILLPL